MGGYLHPPFLDIWLWICIPLEVTRMVYVIVKSHV